MNTKLKSLAFVSVLTIAIFSKSLFGGVVKTYNASIEKAAKYSIELGNKMRY